MTTAATLPRGGMPHPLRAIGFVALGLLVGAGIVLVAHSAWYSTPGSASVLEGSGMAASEIRQVAPFTSVDLAGANHVSISIGSQQSVLVHADDNLIDLVTTDVRAGKLVIDDHGDFGTKSPMSVEVTLPILDAVTMSGSGTLTAEGIEAEALRIRLPGSGIVRASGTTDQLQATVEGSGELLLDDLIAARAIAIVSGSGMIRLAVSEELDASISGSGMISYGGSPSHVTKSVSGSGAIVEQ